MKRFALGVAVGIGFSVVLLFAWQWWLLRPMRNEMWLFDGAPRFVERHLEGAKVLNVSVSPDSKTEVNYFHDKLYDVHITYERQDVLKRITLTYGTSKGNWIGPSVTDLVILDDTAKVVHRLAGGASPAVP